MSVVGWVNGVAEFGWNLGLSGFCGFGFDRGREIWDDGASASWLTGFVIY